MTTDSSHADGTVSQEELAYVERRARSGFAAVITSCAYVDENGRAWSGIGATTARHAESLRSLATAIKSGGSAAILQIYDGGRIADPALVGAGAMRSPSAIASSRPGAVVPRALSSHEVAALIEQFGRAARFAVDAGFDGVEVHGANHYLIHQFLSPRANRRDDEWGGSLERRTRFALEVTTRVRESVDSKVAVGFRFNPFEAEPEGFRLDATMVLVDQLADVGIDYVHISMDDFRRNAPQPEDRDWTRERKAGDGGNPIQPTAATVAGRCAVIASGGIRSIDDAHEALSLGADAVAVGRAALIDPEWLSKIAAGEPKSIRSALPNDESAIVTELTLPRPMVRYILSRPGWIPRQDGLGAPAPR